jgi:hypothetical protein
MSVAVDARLWRSIGGNLIVDPGMVPRSVKKGL